MLDKIKTIIIDHVDGLVNIIYDFNLATRTVKLDGKQLGYVEYTSNEFLEWDYVNTLSEQKANSKYKVTTK